MSKSLSSLSPSRLAQDFVSAAKDFERSRIEELKLSRKIAWVVASVAALICAVAVTGFVAALVLRTEPEPVILKVDQSTGATTVLRSIRDASDKYDEVVNKYWLAQYVRLCETYDWYNIAEQSAACSLMSEESIAVENERRVRAAGSPLVLLKDKGKVSVKVVSIGFIGETAQVRYTSEKLNASGDNPDGSPVQKWIATISYRFQPGLMTEQQRLINPLGFKVDSYRIDPEVIK